MSQKDAVPLTDFELSEDQSVYLGSGTFVSMGLVRRAHEALEQHRAAVRAHNKPKRSRRRRK